MKKYCLLILAVFLFFQGEAQLKINEIMPRNISVLRDASTEYSMWVEIYNPTAADINLSGFFFSDDADESRQWNPGQVTVSAGGYQVLFFEREEYSGHANFKLDPDGGTLYLFNRTGGLVDKVDYPAQYRNISYGRKQDGAADWVFFETASPGTSNNGNRYATERCGDPAFLLQGGFYASSQTLRFANPADGESIYYTIDGSEPTEKSTRYASSVNLNKTTVVRAKTFSSGKLPGDVVSMTYFIGERTFDLPVISIITDQVNLTDNTYGIYVAGTNGVGNYCDATPYNYNRNWDRPANFELYDVNGNACLNQEVDIALSGGCTRYLPLKSMKIYARQKFGKDRLGYDFFPTVKPGQQYKSIVLRNSSNDFYYSMMRDGFIQTLVGNPMDLEYQAYQPSVIFINGTYYGLINIRERHTEDMIYSKYGINKDNVVMEEASYDSFPAGQDYQDFYNFFANEEDMNRAGIFDEISAMMDVDDCINYYAAEIYAGNTDWSHNNYIMWKRLDGGKWRWIVNDIEFGYGLSTSANNNTLAYAIGEGNSWSDWSVLVFRQLMNNDTFRERFIDNMCVQISSTFSLDRTTTLLDSLAAQIENEIVYHKAKWGSSMTLDADVARMKSFATDRPAYMLGFIGSRYLNNASYGTLSLTANISGASYYLNDVYIKNASIDLKYFQNREMSIRPNRVPGYVFKQWEYSSGAGKASLFDKGSAWKYYAASAIPSDNWYVSDYDDSSWSSANAQFGYGNKGEATTISYGSNASNKYTTSYYRKTLNISSLSSKSNFSMSLLVDDGAVVYVNGAELGRYNMPSGTVAYSTFSTTYSGTGDTYTETIPVSMLQEGENVIAVEVHQCDLTSSDVVFDMSISYATTGDVEITTNEVFTGTIGSGFSLKAIYEASSIEPETAGVLINELVASNNRVEDEYGDKDDYIELYNNTDAEINIAGWYLTDTPIYPMLSVIPDTDSSKTAIPARGWLVLWADGEPEQGVLHLGFKLSADGETVLLSRLSNHQVQLIDSVSMPALDKNMSYARVPDGGTVWHYQDPTPAATNVISSIETSLVEGGINVYPTVVSSELFIVHAESKECRLLDLSGKTLRSIVCQSSPESIDMSEFHSGMYLLQVGDKYFKIIRK